MTRSHYLCSYHPLGASAAGREAVRLYGLPPFIDGSCRREPDFQAERPSVSGLCRGPNFAPRLQVGSRIAYITIKGRYDGDWGWRLVALLTVERRFESHADAAAWYLAQGFALPSNCMMAGNEPQPYDQTNRNPPQSVKKRVNAEENPALAVRLWDATYRPRVRNYGTFLACRADFLELWFPPILRRADLISMFRRIPGTQNPPMINEGQFAQLVQYAANSAEMNA